MNFAALLHLIAGIEQTAAPTLCLEGSQLWGLGGHVICLTWGFYQQSLLLSISPPFLEKFLSRFLCLAITDKKISSLICIKERGFPTVYYGAQVVTGACEQDEDVTKRHLFGPHEPTSMPALLYPEICWEFRSQWFY